MPIIGSPGESVRNYVGGNQDGLMGLGKDSNEVKFSAVEGGSEEERYEQGLSTPSITQEQAVANYVKQFEQDRAKRTQEIEDYRKQEGIVVTDTEEWLSSNINTGNHSAEIILPNTSPTAPFFDLPVSSGSNDWLNFGPPLPPPPPPRPEIESWNAKNEALPSSSDNPFSVVMIPTGNNSTPPLPETEKPIATISYLTDKDVTLDDPVLLRVDAEKPKAFASFGASMALEAEPSEPKITSNPFVFSFSASGSLQENPAIKAKQSTIEALQNAVNNASSEREANAYRKALKSAQKELDALTAGDKTEPQESPVSLAENNNPRDSEAQTRAKLEKDLKEKSDRDFEIEYKLTKQQAQKALDEATKLGSSQNSNNSNGPQFTFTVETFKSMEKKAKEEYMKDAINGLSPHGGIRNALSNISQQDAGKLILALAQGATIVSQAPKNKEAAGDYNPENKVISIPLLTILQPGLSSSEKGALETVIVHELLHHILLKAGYKNTLAAEIAITDIGTEISGKETSLKDLEAQTGGSHSNLPLNDDGKTLDFLVRLGLLSDSRKKDLEKAYLQPKKK